MLVDVAIVSVMHMPIVQVVRVARVLHLWVRAASVVRVLVLFMNGMFHDLSVAS